MSRVTREQAFQVISWMLDHVDELLPPTHPEPKRPPGPRSDGARVVRRGRTKLLVMDGGRADA
jgi:hypothetical protein